MDNAFRLLTQSDARAIATWTYAPPYDFYNWNASDDPNDLLLTLPPIIMIDDESGSAAGFVCFGRAAQVPSGWSTSIYDDALLDIGFGLRPDLTGRGLGSDFVEASLLLGASMFRPSGFRLTVAAFNRRAIRVYERAQFQASAQIFLQSHGSDVPFIIMERPAVDPRLHRAIVLSANDQEGSQQ